MNAALIISLAVFATIVAFASSSSQTYHDAEEAIPYEPIGNKVESSLHQKSLPQQFRRWQQNLIRREGKLVDREAYQTFKERELSITQKGISLSQREVELQDLANEIAYQNKLGQLEKKEMLIEVDGKRIELDRLINDVQQRENLVELRYKEVTLNGQKVELQGLLNQVLHEGKQVEYTKKEVLHEQKILAQSYKEKSFELEKTMSKIQHLFMDFKLEQKSWSIHQKEENMKLYQGKLNLLEQSISQMYNIRMRWLQIQGKDNRLTNREQGLLLTRREDHLTNREEGLKLTLREDRITNREEGLKLNRWESSLINREDRLQLSRRDNSITNREAKLRLQQLFDATQSKIRELAIDRDELRVEWDRKTLENKWASFREVQRLWYEAGRIG